MSAQTLPVEAAVAVAKSMSGGRAHYVYKAYRGSEVIYVGCTNDLDRRLSEHARKSGWWSSATAVETREYPTMADALLAERELIRVLAPSGNTVQYEATATPAEREMESDAAVSEAMFGLIFGGLMAAEATS